MILLRLLGQTTVENIVVVPQMEGVTTALVAFIFVCVIYPRIVKNRPQFYAALAAVIAIILLHSLGAMLKDSAGFQVFSGALVGLLQAGAILLLFLSAGGITLKELGSDMARAYEVIRRGEEEKEVIIPIGGEQPKPRSQPGETIPPTRTPETAPPAEKIDLPLEAGWPTKAPPDAKGDTSSLPLT
jgi:uncharacterized membrane protein